MASLPSSQLPGEGQLYGKYKLLEKLAVGGMAEVFKAASTSIGGFEKQVALKRLLPHLTVDAEFVSLFIAEAKLTVSLTHGNIVQVFDFGRIDNNYYLALELVDGKDMTQVLIKHSQSRQMVPVEVAFYIMSTTLRGLQFAHSRKDKDGLPLGIVHRDVSPHNIMVSYDGEVKITDFGIAKARTKVALTRPGVVLGKFAYMSPEQAKGQDVDARSDVYSAGITLYEALTSRRLFYSEDPSAILSKVRDPKVPPPSKYNPEIMPHLDELVLKALAPDPEDRFQTAREFANALEAELHQMTPGFNDAHLSKFMKDLFEDEVGPDKFGMAADQDIDRPTVRIPAFQSHASTELPVSPGEGRLNDPVLMALYERMQEQPNLWTLVEMAQYLGQQKRKRDAARVLRTAGSKFAQNGHLVQSVAIYVELKKLMGWNANLALEVEAVRNLPGATNQEVEQRIGDLGTDEIGMFLRTIIASQGPADTSKVILSPLFSFLDAAEFANLVQLLETQQVEAGQVIAKEGQAGQTLSIIARGRVLIYCSSYFGEKVYLSSLADGDCFGEFTFFTGENRVATVEALEDVLLFNIHKKDFDRILDRFPNLTNALLRFYKTRVVDTLLAKSEVFGGLRQKERAWLLDKLRLEHRAAQEVIIREGETSDGFYLVKSGEVEVYSERAGYVFIDKLKSGQFFGEIGALTGQPRNASVRALGPCELLRLSGEDLQGVLAARPEIQQIVRTHIAWREAETARRVTAGGRLT